MNTFLYCQNRETQVSQIHMISLFGKIRSESALVENKKNKVSPAQRFTVGSDLCPASL